ncbi:MAG: DegT/DnrJ/EryC1/StrS family aminotransferase [Candidatus Levybacteria bacterium]|nr:DegT/DnrJ/EryC1/StrS family aminotransferase [Candidatus Levybacteria bacterium]
MNIIKHNKPLLGKDELNAVDEVIRSEWIIADSQVKKFEKSIASMNKFKYAVALNSGTAAIHLALLSLGVKKSDEVILSAFTVADPLNAINYTGAKTVLVDVEKNSCDIDVEQIKRKITNKTKAIIVPHMLGSFAKIEELENLGIPIINDCAQSIGGIYKGKPIGSYGDLTIFSFYATKLITTGQGGMVLTNNKRRAKFMRDTIDYNGRTNYKVRFNYPMTDLSAAVGNVQLKKLDSFIKRRREIGLRYQNTIKDKNISFFPNSKDDYSNYYRFVLKFTSRKKRDDAKKLFIKNRITAIIPIKEYELLYNCVSENKKDYPNSLEMANTCLSIPIYPALKEEEIKRIVEVLESL